MGLLNGEQETGRGAAGLAGGYDAIPDLGRAANR